MLPNDAYFMHQDLEGVELVGSKALRAFLERAGIFRKEEDGRICLNIKTSQSFIDECNRCTRDALQQIDDGIRTVFGQTIKDSSFSSIKDSSFRSYILDVFGQPIIGAFDIEFLENVNFHIKELSSSEKILL
jgi:hypothetical protein